jgi:glycosyltransferase involved in cell wall biosynthesis
VTAAGRTGRRIAVVVSICVERDAISAAAAEQAGLLSGLPDVESVTLFTARLERPVDVDAEQTVNAWALLNSAAFRACDLVILHWGIYTPLFDVVWALDPQRQRAVVHFHNVTPVDLVAEDVRPTIRRSLQQIEAVPALGLDVWSVSTFNERTLLEIGTDPERITFVPFVVEPPRPLVDHRRSDMVDLLCVSRFTSAKGTDVIVAAMARLARDHPGRFRLTLVGNRTLSDPTHLARLDRMIEEHELTGAVRFTDADDDALWSLYEQSHVVVSPSLHEGLCVPIIEGYLAGCRAVGTTAGNLPFLVESPDPVVAPGDPDALAAAIVTSSTPLVGDELADWRERTRRTCERYSRPATVDALRAAIRRTPTAPVAANATA